MCSYNGSTFLYVVSLMSLVLILFFKSPPTIEIYTYSPTLPLPDARRIFRHGGPPADDRDHHDRRRRRLDRLGRPRRAAADRPGIGRLRPGAGVLRPRQQIGRAHV